MPYPSDGKYGTTVAEAQAQPNDQWPSFQEEDSEEGDYDYDYDYGHGYGKDHDDYYDYDYDYDEYDKYDDKDYNNGHYWYMKKLPSWEIWYKSWKYYNDLKL